MASQLLIVATVVFGVCVDRTNPDTDPGSIWISLTWIHHVYINRAYGIQNSYTT